jgi:SAM-dependent methyltransferase
VKTQATGLRIELGCGQHKQPGFIGIDTLDAPGVDVVLDLNNENLPFEDDSVGYVYSNHAFEHFANYRAILKEIFRVSRPGATVEIWTPYGKSNDGLLFGHNTFFTETSFKHICYEYDRFFLEASPGYFQWLESHYNLWPGISDHLEAMGIPIDFALDHMFNIALEWGVFLSVRKDADRAPGPQIPERKYFYGRADPVFV